MEQLAVLDYLKLNKWQQFVYKLKLFFCGIPAWFVALGKKIWAWIKSFGLKVRDGAVDIYNTFKNGSWKTRVSFFLMGFGSIMYGQWLRGVLFMLFEIVFIVFMALYGGHMLSKFGTLGTVQGGIDEVLGTKIDGDDSFKILLYGILTIIFMLALLYTWRLNVKQCRLCDEIAASGKKIKSSKEDIQSLLDDQFHKTLLALPLTGILLFTVFPIIFMILVAFTNYDGNHDGNANLFTWVGWNNFNTLFNFKSGQNTFAVTFGEILAWTFIWAIFATFTNYFLGMFVAMMINKKGIKIKKVWRTILVMTIAIPQFISLLYVSKMFARNGLLNMLLYKLGIYKSRADFIDYFAKPHLARAMVIIINIWIGIPYLMLISTGILMNIPQDLYESARIDGANVWQQYTKITLPYMLFVTGPYLLTSFIGNLNNFNVIYLLTGGGPDKLNSISGVTPGDTDLLISWLYKITLGNGQSGSDYKLASVIGIMIFLIVSILSLIVYNVLPSNKNEEEFS